MTMISRDCCEHHCTQRDGPIVDHVNLNTPIHDCLTGIDITPDDYRIPWVIADVSFLGKIDLEFGYIVCVCL